MSVGRTVDLELARYRNLSEYVPDVGDFIIEIGWFKTRFGVVSGVRTNVISVVFSSLPFTLCTFTEEEQKKHTEDIHIADVVRSKAGQYTISKAKAEDGLVVMYI